VLEALPTLLADAQQTIDGRVETRFRAGQVVQNAIRANPFPLSGLRIRAETPGRRYLRLVTGPRVYGFLDLYTGCVLYAHDAHRPDPVPRGNLLIGGGDPSLGRAALGPFGVRQLDDPAFDPTVLAGLRAKYAPATVPQNFGPPAAKPPGPRQATATPGPFWVWCPSRQAAYGPFTERPKALRFEQLNHTATERARPPADRPEGIDNTHAIFAATDLPVRVLRLSPQEMINEDAEINAASYVCRDCGQSVEVAAISPARAASGFCFHCSYWEDIIAGKQAAGSAPDADGVRLLVKAGRFYVVKPTSSAPGYARGFSGMSFTFHLLDGTVVESNDVWNGSTIPERFRPRLPDDAVNPDAIEAARIAAEQASEQTTRTQLTEMMHALTSVPIATASPGVDRQTAFASLGEPVEPATVPELVRAGREVWSYGYGEDLEPDEFTTIESDDLWPWDPVDPNGPNGYHPEGAAQDVRTNAAVIASWAPFRVGPDRGSGSFTGPVREHPDQPLGDEGHFTIRLQPHPFDPNGRRVASGSGWEDQCACSLPKSHPVHPQNAATTVPIDTAEPRVRSEAEKGRRRRLDLGGDAFARLADAWHAVGAHVPSEGTVYTDGHTFANCPSPLTQQDVGTDVEEALAYLRRRNARWVGLDGRESTVTLLASAFHAGCRRHALGHELGLCDPTEQIASFGQASKILACLLNEIETGIYARADPVPKSGPTSSTSGPDDPEDRELADERGWVLEARTAVLAALEPYRRYGRHFTEILQDVQQAQPHLPTLQVEGAIAALLNTQRLLRSDNRFQLAPLVPSLTHGQRVTITAIEGYRVTLLDEDVDADTQDTVHLDLTILTSAYTSSGIGHLPRVGDSFSRDPLSGLLSEPAGAAAMRTLAITGSPRPGTLTGFVQ
jgi:hypothetical protein